MNDQRPIINVGGGLCNMLFITFLVLKLTKVIDWSWWYVTAPLWGGAVVILGIVLIALVVAFLVAMIQELF